MNCINDLLCGKYSLIGIRDFVTCPHPDNILYINDIPGITIKNAASIVNDEHRTGIELLNNKIRLAYQTIFNRFSHIVSSQFKFNDVIEARKINNFGTKINPAEDKNKGLLLRRWRSETAKIYIEEIYIKVKQSGIATITIKDGDLKKNYNASLLANVTNKIKINYKAESEHVYITFNQKDFDTYGCELNEYTGCKSCGSGRHANYKLQVKGWDGNNEQNTCFGMGVMANVKCYEEEIICQVLPRMAFMMWYQAGIYIFEEYLASGRVNPVTIFTKDQAQNTLDNLTQKLSEEEEQFKNNINSFLKTTRGECFTCNGTRSAYVLP